jgi:hypothetical protein
MVTPRAEYTCFGANYGKNAAELPSPAAEEVSNPLRDPGQTPSCALGRLRKQPMGGANCGLNRTIPSDKGG